MPVLRNHVVRKWAGREDEIPNPPPPPAVIGHTKLLTNTVPRGIPYDMPKFSSVLPTPDTSGDFDEMCLPAGEGVKLIKDIRPAAQIVRDMMDEASHILKEYYS